MTEELVISILSDVFYTTFIILLPILGVALVVGVLVSIFQAVTSIQEMTLTFVPKILIMAVCIIILMPWMMGKMIDITTRMFTIFSQVVK
jgi:flagellar biosynthetic protein FliQ